MSAFSERGIKAVLFDKDGTLLDFEATWRPLADGLLDDITRFLGLDAHETASVGEALGIREKGFSSESIFVQGTADDMLHAVYRALRHKVPNVEELRARVREGYTRRLRDGTIRQCLAEGVLPLIRALVERGYILGIATSDGAEATSRFLEESGLTGAFDFVACDDGKIPPKPAPAIAIEMCGKFGLLPGEIAMVGDSLVDMEFAANAGLGYSIYIDGPYGNPSAKAMADVVVKSLSEVEKLC